MRWTWYWAALLFSPALAFTTQSSLPSRDVKIWSSRFSFLNRRREELEAERAAAAAAAAVAAAEAAPPPEWTRRAALQGGVLTAASLYASTETNRDQYGLWGTLPIGPYKTKRTAPMETIVDGVMWSFDQKFGILNVQVPSRMVVIKLSAASGGGLWIYNPIAATRNLVECVRALEKVHGPVRHIVLGTVAIEHKTYCGPFAQKFPQATVWLQPGQYAVPLDLSPELLGFPTGGRTKVLPAKAADTPWAADLDQETLGPFISRDGAFGETAFFHAATKTVVLTDTVVQVTDELPEIYRLDKRPLLYHSRTTITDVIDPNDEESLRRGWRRIQLFGLFFMPAGIDVKSVDEAFRARRPDINGDFAGLFPWDWVGDDDVKSFEAIRGGRGSEKNGKNGGGLLVAPILQTLILNRNPVEVLDWADRVSRWDFKRIVPAHLKNNIAADGASFRRAFTFLEEGGEPAGQPKPLDKDLQTLRDAEVSLMASGAIVARPPKLSKANRAAVLEDSRYGCRKGICTPRAPVEAPAAPSRKV